MKTVGSGLADASGVTGVLTGVLATDVAESSLRRWRKRQTSRPAPAITTASVITMALPEMRPDSVSVATASSRRRRAAFFSLSAAALSAAALAASAANRST